MVKKVRVVVTSEEVLAGKDHKAAFWGAGCVPHLDWMVIAQVYTCVKTYCILPVRTVCFM